MKMHRRYLADMRRIKKHDDVNVLLHSAFDFPFVRETTITKSWVNFGHFRLKDGKEFYFSSRGGNELENVKRALIHSLIYARKRLGWKP